MARLFSDLAVPLDAAPAEAPEPLEATGNVAVLLGGNVGKLGQNHDILALWNMFFGCFFFLLESYQEDMRKLSGIW